MSESPTKAAPKAGDAVDQSWIRFARTALTGTIMGGLGMMMGWRAFEGACGAVCQSHELPLLGVMVAFGAVAAYSGARGVMRPCLGAAVGSSFLFALGVLHVAWPPLMGLHEAIVGGIALGAIWWFLWWLIVAVLGILIWEGVHRGVDLATHAEHKPKS